MGLTGFNRLRESVARAEAEAAPELEPGPQDDREAVEAANDAQTFEAQRHQVDAAEAAQAEGDQLESVHGVIQSAGADSLNEGSEEVSGSYTDPENRPSPEREEHPGEVVAERADGADLASEPQGVVETADGVQHVGEIPLEAAQGDENADDAQEGTDGENGAETGSQGQEEAEGDQGTKHGDLEQPGPAGSTADWVAYDAANPKGQRIADHAPRTGLRDEIRDAYLG